MRKVSNSSSWFPLETDVFGGKGIARQAMRTRAETRAAIDVVAKRDRQIFRRRILFDVSRDLVDHSVKQVRATVNVADHVASRRMIQIGQKRSSSPRSPRDLRPERRRPNCDKRVLFWGCFCCGACLRFSELQIAMRGGEMLGAQLGSLTPFSQCQALFDEVPIVLVGQASLGWRWLACRTGGIDRL